MTRARRLYAVQEVDLQRDAILSRLARVMAALKGSPALQQVREAMAEAEAALATVEPQLRDCTRERDDVKAHIAREDQKLYGGRITSPKELQNLQRETESLRRQLAQLEDRAIDLMIARDEAMERLAQLRVALAEASAAAAAEAARLERDKHRLTAELRQINSQRAERTAAAVPTDVQHYEQLRRKKGGRAVARLGDGVCGACGMQPPRQDLDRILDDQELVHCPGCGRILAG